MKPERRRTTHKKHKVISLNENKIKPQEFESSKDSDKIWYLNNGASNHMTGYRQYFTKIDETIKGKVHFGDDLRIDIKGKGSIDFVSENGSKRVLTVVYYIPELRNNIISHGQATEAGCEARMKDNYLTLHDIDGNLITKASRARNRLYKVTMNTVDAKCFQVQQESEFTRWHARLGHIGMDSKKAMIRK